MYNILISTAAAIAVFLLLKLAAGLSWWISLLIALPVLQGWQWVALISPVFVTLLLTRVSGVPLLEKRADLKWGGQAEYETYKKQTPVLIPHIK